MGFLDKFRKPAESHTDAATEHLGAGRPAADSGEPDWWSLSWDQLREGAMAHAQAQTSAHSAAWGMDSADWAVDMTTRVLTFTNVRVRAEAPMQVIGTLSPDGTFMFGWDHPSVPEEAGMAAKSLRDYGEEHDLPELTTQVVPASMEQAWQYAAVANVLTGGQGVYSGAAGPTRVFMTFGQVSLSQP